MSRFIIKTDRFFSEAQSLRKAYDDKFKDPKAADSARFVWDYWHVPGQYTHLRTPAYHYFPQKVYSSLEKRLLTWGRDNLGCESISPPWLSCYVDGCEQEIHSDVPHGPWAFVFSLTKWRSRKFRGGETFIMKPELLDYWRNFADAPDRERNSFVELVTPEFNRLTVFDPRFPHGVRRVSGTNDPREGRLVIHGWFTEPRPYMKGPLSAKQVAPVLDAATTKITSRLSELGAWHGTMSLRLSVQANGELKNCRILVNTLLCLDSEPYAVQAATKLILQVLKASKFPRAGSSTEITLPLLFR